MATLSGLSNLQVLLILSVWGFSYSPSSKHVFPILQGYFQLITWFLCFCILTLLWISCFTLSSLLVYATLPPILWDFFFSQCMVIHSCVTSSSSSQLTFFMILVYNPERLLFSATAEVFLMGESWNYPIPPTQHHRWCNIHRLVLKFKSMAV